MDTNLEWLSPWKHEYKYLVAYKPLKCNWEVLNFKSLFYVSSKQENGKWEKLSQKSTSWKVNDDLQGTFLSFSNRQFKNVFICDQQWRMANVSSDICQRRIKKDFCVILINQYIQLLFKNQFANLFYVSSEIIISVIWTEIKSQSWWKRKRYLGNRLLL